MIDDLQNATSLGKTIYDQATTGEYNGVAIGDSAFDFTTGVFDNSPLGQAIDIPVEKIELGFSKLEKTRAVEEVKQKFHMYVSQKTANSVSAFTTPSVLAADRRSQLQGKTGQAWLTGAQQIYAKHQGERLYKMQRKAQDMARSLKKNPMKLAKVPLSVVPLGEIAKLGIKAGEYAVGKFTAKRRARKKGEYTSGNNQVLEAKLGKQEYNRKKAKWQAKDIADLGPQIQRNLYKLKQSVEILNARKEQMNLSSQKYLQDPSNAAALGALVKSREDAAMSLYEVKHYVEKITAMCKAMEATAFTIGAYMEGLDQITDQSEKDILNTF
ncbi:hypothetical protein L4174_014770 [Photobacterium sp. CCB-ST2H9]|uniref:hypothetical protein n=1 Tax=Photobacterium sp. CCB-ST2H9 TaxID=2912855 RepID=UPI002004B516|nr:hypothetical protein [Photobacterium sp. CCB-ST2H9]UTM57044.1 hypothetical protein L4174_014770 [Photobacterium sp. CCB-ST2H9]